MRTLILNDTRSERHLGCELVMQNLLRYCDRAGLKVVGTIANSAANDELLVQQRAADYDLLLINGEGTLHHDRPKGLALCRAASAAARQGKKAVLLNTVWQENVELNRYLPHFNLIFCRESRSAAAIQAAGSQAVTVPDLVFATETDPASHDAPRRGRGTLVVDSVHRETTLRWAWRALYRRHGFATMHDCNLQLLRRRPWLNWGIRASSGAAVAMLSSGWVEHLLRYERVISGRFHGCCLAMLLDLPVLGIRSNTHKTEGLLEDVGLGDLALLRDEGRAPIERQFEQVAAHADLVRQFVASARRKIADMFGQIARLASHGAAPRPKFAMPPGPGIAAGGPLAARRA